MRKLKIALLVNTSGDGHKSKLKGPKDINVELDSPETANAYADALKSQGHEVYVHQGDYMLPVWLPKIKPDICFNTCEGVLGESREAHVPAILEMMGIPYTGPTPLAAALTLDKAATKKVLAFHKILTPSFEVFESEKQQVNESLRFPLFVKPVHEGTGMGIKNESIVKDATALKKMVKYILANYKQPALVEEYIEGKDLTCGIVGNGNDVHIFPVSEIDFSGYKHGLEPIYGVQQKIYYADEYKNKCPAPLPDWLTEKVKEVTHKTFLVTGARDYARVDFRLNSLNELFVIEINALPGISPHSDLTLTAYSEGYSYEKLILSILHAALKRYKISL